MSSSQSVKVQLFVESAITHFVGELVDEKSSIRLVGFDSVSQAKLEELSQKKLPILLENCDVQYNKFTKKLEVIVKQIDVSSRTFRVADVDGIGAKSISLKELRSMQASKCSCEGHKYKEDCSAHLRPGSRFQHQNLHYVHTAVLFAIYSVCCIKMIQNEAQCFLFPKN